MNSLFLILIICSYLLGGCGKKERKQSPRCLYDYPVITETLMDAVEDEERFAVFKKNPYFNLLWENHSFEEGEMWLKQIAERHFFLKEKFEGFRLIDQVGSPRVYDFGEDGIFSPSTLRLMAITGDLYEKLGSLDGADIVQIGGGCGSWCKLLNDLYELKSYTIVDLPESLSLSKKCLEKMGVNAVRFFTPQDLPKGVKYTLCISDRSFSEFDRVHQELFFKRIIACSSSGYFIGYEFPKHYGVAGMNLDQLKKKFEKTDKQAKVYRSNLKNREFGQEVRPTQLKTDSSGCFGIDEFSNDLHHYCIHWRERSNHELD